MSLITKEIKYEFLAFNPFKNVFHLHLHKVCRTNSLIKLVDQMLMIHQIAIMNGAVTSSQSLIGLFSSKSDTYKNFHNIFIIDNLSA